ncbi:MAG TPA: lactose ABC transporter permease [Firmicutes bacterium]|jgi:lactose/L-arabinose transport system permease protein|nr:lactose ABC transporter permease [Bacillota bacterium]HBK67740.1 lactose ABC transporter permease [Bacillota bacterium]
MKGKYGLVKIFQYAFLTIAFIIAVFPFYWMVVGTTNSALDIIKGKITFGDQLFHNFKTLFTKYDVVRIFLNSLKISILTVIGQLVISSMAGYGFELFTSRTREKVYGVVIMTMMVPFAALMIPLFKLIVKLNLLDTHAGLILTTLASVFLIFFFRQSFKSFPKEIIQAARVDGAGELRIFYSIVVPSMKATYAAAAIYSFMTSWNGYMWPLIVLQSNQNKTMQLLISTMSSAYFPEYGLIMVAIMLSTLPMIIIFFRLQNYFVQGITGSLR